MATSNRQEVGDFVDRVRKVIFLGTPHIGSGSASLLDRLKLVMRPSAATLTLVKCNPDLLELNSWYRSWANSRAIAHLALFETKPLRWVGVVVDRASSDLGLLAEAIPVDADHLTLCKPTDRLSDTYTLIRAFIERDESHTSTGSNQGAIRTQSRSVEQPESTSPLSDLDRLPFVTENVTALPQDLVDREIAVRLRRIRQSRFFAKFPLLEEAERLANEISSGQLSHGSVQLKAQALAWCARLLANTKTESAKVFLQRARVLAEIPEVRIADGFMAAREVGIEEALGVFATMSTPIARSSALIAMLQKSGASEALDWMSGAGLTIEDLDPDGKVALISAALESERWDAALQCANACTSSDYEEAPALLHFTGLAKLMQTIEPSLRSSAIRHVQLRSTPFRWALLKASWSCAVKLAIVSYVAPRPRKLSNATRRETRPMITRCGYNCAILMNRNRDVCDWKRACAPLSTV
jgi:hypothetical protein